MKIKPAECNPGTPKPLTMPSPDCAAPPSRHSAKGTPSAAPLHPGYDPRSTYETEPAFAQYQLGFFSGGYTGTAGTKPFRFGISTFGRVLASRTSFSPMMPLR
jgi:hypothetical protein